ncbi:MAG: hypothetical protein ACRD2U_06585 [Terriglobales bacterium]
MNWFAARLFAGALICTLLGQPMAFAQGSAGVSSSQSQTPPPANSSELPDSPGAAQNASPQAAPVNSPAPTAASQQQPTGAAAAPAGEVSGTAVSRPAGSAIAPPKQRQVRSFLIKMGLLAGVGVAVGTVAALSLSSPARVPGSPH